MGSLGQFTTKFGQGVRPNLFSVATGGLLASDEVLLIKAAALPSASLGTITIPYRGREIKRAGDRTFTDWSITVLCDESMEVHKKFMEWSETFMSLNDTDRNSPNYLQWQVSPVSPTDGAHTATFSLEDCWPIEIGTVDLSYESTDAVAEFTVSIGFDHWKYADQSQNPG